MIKQPKNKYKQYSLFDSEINIKKSANKEEKNIAKDIANTFEVRANRTINSGMKLFDPGDIRLTNCIVEIKSALKQKQIIIKEEMLSKLLSEGLRVNKDIVMILNFPKSNLRIKKWIVVPYE